MSAVSAENVGSNGASATAQMFVINLAASTSPMALSHPTAPELKRFTFFVSRQREDGRERFRLHMGYFATQEEAEALLLSIRDIYPAAWAGPAPTTGMGRRGRIAPGNVVAATPAASVGVMVPVAPSPEVAAAQVAAAAKVVSAPVIAAPVVAAPAAVAPVIAAAPVAQPAMSAAVAAPAAAAAASTRMSDAEALDAMSNVRDVIAELSEAPRAASKPAAPVAKAAAPVAKAAEQPAPVALKAAPVAAAKPTAEISAVDALRLLEEPAPRSVPVAAPVAAKTLDATQILPPLTNPFEGLEKEPEVRLVTPEDTQTLTDIKVDRQNNAPPCFAVQLVWSVTPIDVATLPHLAIFDAYTLYNVEGNRQGRRWYGLRLGFFSDPNSATQVANYVRSDYANVAVVPVAVKERDRARGGASAPQASEVQKTTDDDFRREAMEGFELLADDAPPAVKRDLEDTVKAKVPVAAPVAPRVTPRQAAAANAKAAILATKAASAAAPASTTPRPTTGKRVVARRRVPQVPQGALDRTVSSGVGGAEVLESTLEILGASTLSLEGNGRELITDAAARKPEKSGRAGRFSKLLSRLGGG